MYSVPETRNIKEEQMLCRAGGKDSRGKRNKTRGSSDSGVPEVAELDGGGQVLESGLFAGIHRKGHSTVAVVGEFQMFSAVAPVESAAAQETRSGQKPERGREWGRGEQAAGSGAQHQR